MNRQGMKWYKTLNIHQKINLKTMCYTICGLAFNDLVYFFNYSGAIEVIHDKLKREGFDV